MEKEYKGNEASQGRYKRLTMLIMAVLLLIIGGLLGYIWRGPAHPLPNEISSTSTQDEGNKKAVALSEARNTYVVRAVKKASPSVVGITTKIARKDIFNRNVVVGEGVGSGVIYNADGYIVTNNHVVEGAAEDTVIVTLSDGKVEKGKVVGTDPTTDLAVVKIETDAKLVPIEWGNSEQIQVGEPAIAIGNPLGLEFQDTVTTGVISSVQRIIDERGQRFPLIQTDAAINPGNSGGALINADGQLVGINSSKISKTGIEGLGFAIPVNEAKPVIDSIIQHGKVVRPYLGLLAIDQKTAQQYDIGFNQKGLLVVRLDGAGPAANSGVRVGDIITSVEGSETATLVQLKTIIDKHKPGDTIAITLYREGGTQTVDVKITQYYQ